MTAAQAPLAVWYERAGVRRDPHRLVVDAGTALGGGHGPSHGAGPDIPTQLRAGKTFFPFALMPHVTHPIVQALPPDRVLAIAARYLFQYLTFTAHFETQVVNRATALIAMGGVDASLPISTRADALKIYVDEGWHALHSLDLVAQLADATRVAALPYDFRPYLQRLDAVGTDLLPGQEVLAQLLQVVVFETLITSILSVVPADTGVLDIVRETIADHARDEGRHHAYFAAFFRELWTRLGPSDRFAAAQCLPQLIRRSIEPDLTPVRAALFMAGLSEHQIAAVVAESYPANGRSVEIVRSARHSVRLFRDCGVLDVPGGLEAFASAGLLDQQSGGPKSGGR